MKSLSLLPLGLALCSLASAQDSLDFESPMAPCDDTTLNPITVDMYPNPRVTFSAPNYGAVIYGEDTKTGAPCTLLPPLGGDQAAVMSSLGGTCAPQFMTINGPTREVLIPYAIDSGSAANTITFEAFRGGLLVDSVSISGAVTGGWVGPIALTDADTFDLVVISMVGPVCGVTPQRLYMDDIKIGPQDWYIDDAPGTCGTAINVTGLPGHMALSGMGLVTPDTFQVEVSDLPPNSFGVLAGATGTNGGLLMGSGVPQGCGNVCIGPVVGRWSTINPVTGNAEVLPLAVDSNGEGVYTMAQSSSQGISGFSGLTTILSGETWTFQFWYRDLGTTDLGTYPCIPSFVPNFNFSNPVQVTWQ